MTVCIAAMAEEGKELILVSDSKVSFGMYSADRAVVKNIPFFGEYAIMFAGNDVAHAGAIIKRAKARAKSLDADDLAEIIYEESQKERDRIAEAQVLRKRLLSQKRFQTSGKKLCTEAVFYDIHSKLDQIGLSLDFLLAGFDKDGQAHLRFANCVTPPQDYDPMGFWSIGSGAHNAIGSFCHAEEHLGLSRYAPTEQVAYHVLAAKFMAESATDVGRETFMVAVRARKNAKNGVYLRFLTSASGGLEHMRAEWKMHGAPRVPSQIDNAISAFLLPLGHDDDVEALGKMAKYSKSAGERLASLKQSDTQKLPEQ